ncbi:MAG: hypothetical protein WBO70_00230 [Erysipelotrichaceae bacterium]
MIDNLQELSDDLNAGTCPYNVLIVSKLMADIINEQAIKCDVILVKGDKIFAFDYNYDFNKFPSSLEEVFDAFVQFSKTIGSKKNKFINKIAKSNDSQLFSIFNVEKDRQKYLDSITACVFQRENIIDDFGLIDQFENHCFMVPFITQRICEEHGISSDDLNSNNINDYVRSALYRVWYEYNVYNNVNDITVSMNTALELHVEDLPNFFILKPSPIKKYFD